MHAPSSSLSGFLRAARQTSSGSAFPPPVERPSSWPRSVEGWSPPPPQGAAGPGSAVRPGAEQLRHSAPPAAAGGSVLCPRLTRRRARPARAAPEAEAAPHPHQASALAARSQSSSAGRVTGSALSLTRPEPQRTDGPGRRRPRDSSGGRRAQVRVAPNARALSGRSPGAGTRWGGRDEPGWQQRVAHMCPRGDRCQVRGWGQSLPPVSDGSAGFPAQGVWEGSFPSSGQIPSFHWEIQPLLGAGSIIRV